MASSKCPKCDGSIFELALKDNIKGANFKMYFVQCASCGTVIGVADYLDTASLLDKIAKKLGVDLFH